MSVAKSTVIPNFLSARSPMALRRLMLLNNKRLGQWLKYDIQFVSGRWYAWYYEDIASSTANKLIETIIPSGSVTDE